MEAIGEVGMCFHVSVDGYPPFKKLLFRSIVAVCCGIAKYLELSLMVDACCVPRRA